MSDLQSRQAHPVDLDLTPWRHGAKHRPVCGNIPFRGDWQKSQAKQGSKLKYDKHSLDKTLKTCSEVRANFRSRVEAELQRLPQAEPSDINRTLLQVCAEMFPPKSRQSDNVQKAWVTDCVKTSLREMWIRFRAMNK